MLKNRLSYQVITFILPVIFFVQLSCRPPAEAVEQRPPNIILIMADDLGYNHLGVYGQDKIETPNLDRLAAEGMRFTQAYAGNTVCAPSRSVLMTGLHVGHTPVRGNSGGIPLREEDVTLAEVLKTAGYTTGLFGKWGLGEAGTPGVPNRQGFDAFFGYLHQIHAHFYYPEYLWQNESKWPLPGNDVGGRQAGEAGGRTYAGDAGAQRTQYVPDEILRHALHFVEANRDRPFFLYWPSVIPHVELAAPAASVEPYLGRFEEEACADPRAGYAANEAPKATLAGMITHLDRNVGVLLERLEALGLAEETLVIFTSDNGAQNNYCVNEAFFNASGPLRGYKRSMYEGGLRVPMIVRWPGRIEAGQLSDHVTYFPDMLPTLAEVGGTNPPQGLDGHSILPALIGEGPAGRPQPDHAQLYWELGDPEGRSFSQAVRMGDWKGVRPDEAAPTELYNLAEDPGETTDVAAAHPDIRARIEHCFATCRSTPRPQVEPLRVEGRYFR